MGAQVEAREAGDDGGGGGGQRVIPSPKSRAAARPARTTNAIIERAADAEARREKAERAGRATLRAAPESAAKIPLGCHSHS